MTTRRIMICVILALMPSVVMSGVVFGIRAILLVALCVMACVVFEGFSRIIMKKEQTIDDMSATLTGVLIALNLPVTIPFWMATVGCFAAIVIVKQLFGGLGQNFANPAIAARIILMLSFTSEMTHWVKPFYYRDHVNITDAANTDIVTAATPLSPDADGIKLTDLLFGFTGGCIGEVCALALFAGGMYLIIRKIISPVTPFAFIGTVAVLSFILGLTEGDINHALYVTAYQVLSGGLMLGAFFMATDYVTTPITQKGKLIFGIGCGVLTFLIRQFGSYPEGVSFSILLMNIVTPYIDRFTMVRPVGGLKEEKKK